MRALRVAGFLSVASLLVFVACGSTSDESPTPDPVDTPPERGVYKTGKYDLPGSCADACGSHSRDGCFCDASCVGWGDCCEDFAQVCPGGPQEWSCDVECTSSHDCVPNEPYCNYDTGKCQQTPPECVTTADCPEGDFCQPTGSCAPFPHFNCRPGWGLFEGDCDNPACIPEECPTGTELDPETCYCLALDAAPSCQSALDCTPAWPYCNHETQICQQEPAQCVSDRDCTAEDGYCHSTGYCWPWPEFNCRPGWGMFEGMCDNAACIAEECPDGTIFSELKCLCLPDCLHNY